MSTEQTQLPNPSTARLSPAFRIGLAVLVGGVAVTLAIFIYSGVAERVRANSELQKSTLDMAVPTVSVIHPRAQDAANEIVLPGNMQAFTATPIYARTSGYLKRWYFDIGAHVANGQLLAEIETPEVDRQLDQAHADLATAQANLRLSQTTAERYELLFKTESVSRQDLEDKRGDLQARKAMVESATYNVRRLQQMQAFQKIYAPFDGVITARYTDVGALINAGASGGSKQLFDIATTGRLRVYVNVPQSDARWAKPGSPAVLTLAELPGRKFPGKIARTAGVIDPSSRTLLTEVDVPNPSGELLPGAYVSVHLTLGGNRAGLILPVNALLFRSEGLRVAVVRDGTVQLVPIVLGRDFGNTVEVANGVTATDAVVENPSDSLASGTRVHVTENPRRKEVTE